MKKYFVLALVVMAFVVAPVMADVAISGEFDYSGVWNLGDKEYAGETDKMELDFAANVDDYNTLKFELEDDQAGTDDNIRDEPLTLNYVKLITDWGKYFGFAESGFGFMSTVGIDDMGYKETVDFTGYELEYSNSAWLGGAPTLYLDFDIMGIVKPYYAMHMDTFGAGTTASSDGADWLLGAVIDVAPVTAEVYYMSTGDITTEDGKENLNRLIGAEAVYSGEVSDGVELTAGGYFKNTYSYGSFYSFIEEAALALGETEANAAIAAQAAMFDESWSMYGFAAGVSAYGATVNVSMSGMMFGSDMSDVIDGSYALSMVGLDGSYDILDWMSVNAGMLLAMGDYADDFTGEESFVGAEFGVCVKPGNVNYGLGYIVTSEDSNGSYWSIQAEDVPANGGLYFIAQVNY